ncbi:glycosyl hydrolase family 61-domain-containing protein [Pseudomassariella vexata]|uniref:lytic cellulose monooxygenase (C4-dehydrogenating) n=1 Tax=Pseudomassariella vexata TaxID=1141098 RepID=A0A1Y2DNV2_9PEZI|nr:glycosyl hydrolase family 61-domain-containing protein [Pseudomassariella vexata]ORY60930.1 glycosyl hydrolase family 61-domain-containing protein [Pseudomassariella vexata]
MKYNYLMTAAAMAYTSSAHTIFVQLESGEITYDVSYGIRTPSYDGPITDVTSNDLACNGGPNPTTPSDKIIDVAAGSSVTAVWRHTLTSGPEDVMDASHLGPTLAYLKKVDDATTDSGVGSGWFKIQEDGFNNGVWGTSTVINNAGEHVIDIPECIEDGQYLLRAEMIALHAASSTGGAQLYMECAQINVSGGTATNTPTTYSIPGIYKATDPGLLVNIYSMTASSTYEIPGPVLFTCAAYGGGPTSTKAGTTLTTSTNTFTSASTTTTSSACAATQWAQCGGIGFAGCASCASGYTCVWNNDYYSQCQ